MIRKATPLWPTVMVVIMLATLLSLGFWQLRRMHEKEVLLELLSANSTAPTVPLSALTGEPHRLAFRPVTAGCRLSGPSRSFPGASPSGAAGQHVFAVCHYSPERKPVAIDLGWTRLRDALPAVDGRRIRVSASVRPWPERTALEGLIDARRVGPDAFGKQAVDMRYFIQAASIEALDGQPAIATEPSPLRPEDIPNNHRSYAIQWFSFAATLVVIYGVYVWRWRRLQAGESKDTVRRS